MTLEKFEKLAEEGFDRLPEWVRAKIQNVALLIEDEPSEEVRTAENLGEGETLLGLYQGVSLDRKSVSDPQPGVDMIFLYRRPILDYWCETGEDLAHVIRHVLIHEIGHHFGFSDEDMERIEEEG